MNVSVKYNEVGVNKVTPDLSPVGDSKLNRIGCTHKVASVEMFPISGGKMP